MVTVAQRILYGARQAYARGDPLSKAQQRALGRLKENAPQVYERQKELREQLRKDYREQKVTSAAPQPKTGKQIKELYEVKTSGGTYIGTKEFAEKKAQKDYARRLKETEEKEELSKDSKSSEYVVSYEPGAETKLDPELARRFEAERAKQRAKETAERLIEKGGAAQGNTIIGYKEPERPGEEGLVTLKVGEELPEGYKEIAVIPKGKIKKVSDEGIVTGAEAQRLEEMGVVVPIVKPGNTKQFVKEGYELLESATKGFTKTIFEAPRIISDPLTEVFQGERKTNELKPEVIKRAKSFGSDRDVLTFGLLSAFGLLEKIPYGEKLMRGMEAKVYSDFAKEQTPQKAVEATLLGSGRLSLKPKSEAQANKILKELEKTPEGKIKGQVYYGQSQQSSVRMGDVRKVTPEGTLEAKKAFPSELLQISRPVPTVTISRSETGGNIVKKYDPFETSKKLITEDRLADVKILPQKEFSKVARGKEKELAGQIRFPYKGKPDIIINKNQPKSEVKSTLQHELLHFKYPKKSEIEILRLEETTKGFKETSKKLETSTIVLPEGTQYITTRIKGKKDAFVRTRVSPEGETTIKVFKEDKLLKTISTQTEPSFKFSEDILSTSKKQYISQPDKLLELNIDTRGSKVIATEGLYKGQLPFGRMETVTREELKVVSSVPETFIRKTPTERETIITPTKFEFVRYPTQTRTKVEEIKLDEYILLQPVIPGTTQIIRQKSQFEINFIKTPKVKKEKPEVTTKQQEDKIIFEADLSGILKFFPQAKEKPFEVGYKGSSSLSSRANFNEIVKRLSQDKQSSFSIAEEQVIQVRRPNTITKTPKVEFTTQRGVIANIEKSARLNLIANVKMSLAERNIQQKELPLLKQTPLTNQIPLTIQQPVLTPLSVNLPIQEQLPIQKELPIQEQLMKQELLTRLRQRQKARVKENIIKTPPPIRPPKTSVTTKRKKRLATDQEESYKVLIKKKLKKVKGKYKSQGYSEAKRGLSKKSAEGFAMSILDKFANRSAKIVKDRPVKKLNRKYENVRNRIGNKFRASKTNKNVIVEKTAFAIDSPTEKRQITYEGIKAKRKKKKR